MSKNQNLLSTHAECFECNREWIKTRLIWRYGYWVCPPCLDRVRSGALRGHQSARQDAQGPPSGDF